MLGTPYQAGLSSAATVTASFGISVTSPVPPGAAVTVFAGASGATTATGVTDSQGNAYTLAASSTSNEYLQAFTGIAAAGLSPPALDAWTVTYSAANSQQKTAIVIALTGAAAAPDITVAANGSSAAASASGTAAAGNETAIACWQSSAASLPSPSSFASLGGFFATLAGWAPVANAGAVTAAASVPAGPWAALLVTWKAAAPVALGTGTAPSGGPQLPPYPVLPAPRTWSAKDKLLAPFLRNDPGNAISLLASPPVFIGAQTVTGQSVPSGTVTPLQLDTDLLDAWASHQQPAVTVIPPLAGWYLAEGWLSLPGTASATVSCAGIQAVQAGVTANTDGAKESNNVTNSVMPDVADLVKVNPATADTISLYALQDAGSSKSIGSAYLKTEWAAASSGTVVSAPVPAAGWTSGATVLAVACLAGAVSVLVADPSGIVTGGTLSLDFGTASADTVTVTSVSGQMIGITACGFAHPANAPVSVPISFAWMNQQVRDKIRFLAYRPVARLTAQASGQAALPAQTWPAGTAVQWTDPTTPGHRCADNFSGWPFATPTRYVFPVSGTWYLYGQVYVTDSASPLNLSAGLAVSGGTIMWGKRVRSAGSVSEGVCVTVRRTLRVTAGQYAEVYASQASGGSLAWKTTAQSCSRMIAVWRGL